jgi:hypothetical protein
MPPRETSHELLAHFEQSKTARLDDFEWIEECAPEDDGIILGCTSATYLEANEVRLQLSDASLNDEPQQPTRGVLWVLQRAAAIAVLTCTAIILAQFAYVVAGENALDEAARAAALEATLPRATYLTVWATVERRLADYPELGRQLQFSLLQNDTSVSERFRAGAGDRIAVAISAPASAILPNWLRRISYWQKQRPISGRAEREVPGRKLRVART